MNKIYKHITIDWRYNMNMNQETSMAVSKAVRDEFKLIAIRSGKKLYELLSESVDLLKSKYNMGDDNE